MIKANRTWIGVRFFELYSHIQLNRYFRQVQLIGESIETEKPVLLISNHFSWWDGFIQIILNKKIIQKQFHVMMLEDQLQNNMILNKSGAFSIKKNSRSIIESLDYCIQLLQSKDNLVLIFPQGEIQSVYTRYFIFEQGLQYVIKRVRDDIQIVFNVNLIDYFSEKKPSLNIYYKAYRASENCNIKTIQSDFNLYADECMKKQIPE